MATIPLFITINKANISSPICIEVENTISLVDLWWAIQRVIYDYITYIDDFKISYGGKELTEWDDTIDNLGICPESTINVIDEAEWVDMMYIEDEYDSYSVFSDPNYGPDTDYDTYMCTYEVYMSREHDIDTLRQGYTNIVTEQCQYTVWHLKRIKQRGMIVIESSDELDKYFATTIGQ